MTDALRSLLEMLRNTVDRYATSEAIVEIGGERINYSELWDRAARLSGGLKNLGIARGDRVAIRLGNGLDWCIAFWGTAHGRRRGGAREHALRGTGSGIRDQRFRIAVRFSSRPAFAFRAIHL